MQASPLMYAAAGVQLLPPLVTPFARGPLGSARRWVVAWCLLLALQDALAYVLGSSGINNLWLGYVGAPVTGGVALWMLSQWHDGATGRLTLRVAIPIFIAVSVALSVRLDNPETFSLFAAPFHALVLLIAAVWTFVDRGLREHQRLVSRDWFWILAGLIIYTATNTAIQGVISYLLAAARRDLILDVFNVKAATSLVAFAAIAGGMLCPLPPMPSGGPSSRPSSPSRSSSARSPSP